MKHLIFIFILVLTIGTYACDSIKNIGTVPFSQLPTNVQDSLISIMKNSSIESNNFSLIDFTQDYTLVNKKTGPWVDKIRIKNNKTGKYFDLDPNTPLPIIVVNNEIYVPKEYNIFVIGVNDNTPFNRYEIL